MKSQQEYIKEIETKKRKLEDEIDSINEELTRIKAQGNKLYNLFNHLFQVFIKIYRNSFKTNKSIGSNK